MWRNIFDTSSDLSLMIETNKLVQSTALTNSTVCGLKTNMFQEGLATDQITIKMMCHTVLTFALLGGVFEHPPLRFFADSKKTAARSAAGFSSTLSPIFLATFVKVSILGHARSGHQVRSSDHTLQKLYNRAPATVFEGKL